MTESVAHPKRYVLDNADGPVDGVNLYTVVSDAIYATPASGSAPVWCMTHFAGYTGDDGHDHMVFIDQLEVPGKFVWYVWNLNDAKAAYASMEAFINERVSIYEQTFPDHEIEVDIGWYQDHN
jgi:hypothetical protein